MFLTELISLDDALLIITENQKVLDTEIISLKNAQGRILANPIYSYHNIPPFNKSTRDGYAIIAEDSFGASKDSVKHFKIIDRIGAGDFSKKTLSHGEAIVIATGAPIPEGANAVIMKEFTSENSDDLEIYDSVKPNQFIVPKAEDIAKGDLIIESNTLIRPQEMGLISSVGYAEVEVFKKPRIKLINTGNELVEPSEELDPAKIINSNQFVISALVNSSGAICDIEHCPDVFEDIKEAISKASNEYDVVITTGGTAISKGDLVCDVVEELGEVLFHGVNIRPGKLAGAGIVNETPIFILSGQPAAAIAQFDIFARPFIFNMQGYKYELPSVKRVSKVNIRSRLGRTDVIKAYSDDDNLIQVLKRGSGMVQSMVRANSYIFIGENQNDIEKDDIVDVIFFKDISWPII